MHYTFKAFFGEKKNFSAKKILEPDSTQNVDTENYFNLILK